MDILQKHFPSEKVWQEETALDDFQHIIQQSNILPTELPMTHELGKTQSENRVGLMWPTELAFQHPAAPLLEQYSQRGCPVDVGKDWSKERIEAAIKRGAHISTKNPEARQALLDETDMKVSENFMKKVRWGDIKHSFPKNLKISPVAMIPHKSRSFRVILDLSFNLLFKGKRQSSVNDDTIIIAPQKAMSQLGIVLHRIVHTLATHYHPKYPFKFCKVDIKDGFWRMSVNEKDAWNFCYTIPNADPATSIDDTVIVVPTALQMGWAESPPFFCAGTETARDVIDDLITSGMCELAPHPSEDKMLKDTPLHISQPPALPINFVEVYVDDFVGGTNNLELTHLRHLSRAVLHGIHSVFPHPDISKHNGEDPISQKKMDQGEGLWHFEKEVLGWIFDGLNFTLFLPPDKSIKLVTLLRDAAKSASVPLQTLQSIAGKLNHASIGIPNGRGLSAPIYRATRGNPAEINMSRSLQQALLDWAILLQQISSRPTHILELKAQPPLYIGFVDACKSGIGGVWFDGTHPLNPTVWRVPIPLDIQKQLVSSANPKGTLSINDLEMAGVLFHWLVLEQISPTPLTHASVAIYCDNTSTVSWSFKFSSTSSVIAGHLLRALALRHHVHRASPLHCLSLAGTLNTMADAASRSFMEKPFISSNKPFLDVFSSLFKLKKPYSWTEYHVKQHLISRVMSLLRGSPLTLASWTQIRKHDINIGHTGPPSVTASAMSHSSETTPASVAASLPQALQQKYGLELLAMENELKSAQLERLWEPSRRPSNWLLNSPRSTRHRRHTLSQWHGLWKDGDDETLQPYLN